MTTTPTSGAAIQRYKIGYHSDEWGQRSSTPSGIPDASGSWVRYADHVTALAAGQATAAQQAPAGVTLRSMIEGMSVSVDVSTGDHDAGHRYFGTVTEVMECQGDKHGVTLLVQDAEPNFAVPTPQAAQTAPAAQQAGERVYAFRRKGLADFCTCDEARYEELSNKPHLFETRVFYTAPQPSPTTQADSVQEDAARYRWLRRWKGQEHEPPFTVQHEIDGTLWGGDLDAAIDAARKQGGV